MWWLFIYNKNNVRPPRSLRSGLEYNRVIFKEIISKIILSKYAIVYNDDCSFNSSSLSLLSWMKKG